MAIGYARVEFVQRSNGKNACTKAAYNSRSRIEFEGNDISPPQTYDWSSKEQPAFHGILLPEGASQKFKSSSVLWNAAEAAEKRYNSVVAMEVLLALPDDKSISLGDRVHLAKTFVQSHFVDKGLAAQIDIHAPERKIQITRSSQELGLTPGMRGNITTEGKRVTLQLENGRTVAFDPQDFTGFVEKESNWHAHVLITTRRFSKDGSDLADKARDLMPRIAKGKVISGPDWGKLWTDHQNAFFVEKGLNLRVDAPGIEAQEHLGPYRMRGRAFALLEEHGRILEENATKSRDVSSVLAKITERQSVFTKEDVVHFIEKHVPPELHPQFLASFWKQNAIVPMIEPKTGAFHGKFSTVTVVDEEKRILRLADHLHGRRPAKIKPKAEDLEAASTPLNPEQRAAFTRILQGPRLACIQGYAGTGKSHLLSSLNRAYSSAGYHVRAFGPDSATADVLREKGFQTAENIYRFLFALHHSKRDIANGKEVWILDEAGKLGNAPLLEFLKEAEKRNVQLIFSGDSAQLASVGRGGMFSVFCERYGSHLLESIQRQKKESHREIAKNLAKGELGVAIDKLSTDSTLRWSSTKNEAIEQLISTWARDTRSLPLSSSLIIAHTNDEVRVLNEMVRIIRKQRGELSGQEEYLCETSHGKVYIGVGDLVEFRKKDNEIGVTNGLFGVLIQASSDKFVVSIRENEKRPRTVVFNPQEYHTFQLGYASTYYRSQGKTISRAYVLHSPALNKKLFYVGLTRHVDEAFYFISKDQAYCLSDLKRQAMRDNVKENTLAFTTMDEIQSQQKSDQKRLEIQKLKESDSFLDRVKGYGISAYDIVKAKASAMGEYVHDRSPSGEFFNPRIPDTTTKATVVAIEPEILPQEKPVEQPKEHKTPLPNPADFFKRCQERNPTLWNSLKPDQQNALNAWSSSAETAFSLKEIVDLSPSENTACFHAWKEACGKRNQSAHELIQRISTKGLTQFLGKKSASFIQDQATRHDAYARRQEFDAGEELKAHIEPLLFRLFPEGPSRKERGSLRFGSKGSLSVVCSGAKAGQFYDFENQEGGGPLKLIQRQLGLGGAEAKEWAKNFLGVAHEIKVPKVFTRPSPAHKDSQWTSVIPPPGSQAPKLEELCRSKLSHYFEETARHPYLDENGKLLYYVLRLKDRHDSTKKITPPLSFGYWKSSPTKPCWELKGFQQDKHTLYNLPHLKEKPHATVLVVEGEKTADLAPEKFPHQDFVCVTWPGGAGAVHRANWLPLMGRKVIIWPDNDKAGLTAASAVCSELRRLGVSSLQMIDPEALQKSFPGKWDLADALPPHTKPTCLSQLLSSALPKGIDPQQVLYRCTTHSKDPEAKARANEILWRVDERLRPELEKTLSGQTWKINEEILTQTCRILMNDSKREGLPFAPDIAKRLSWQTAIFQAQHGRMPTAWEIDTMRNVIGDLWTKVGKERDDVVIDQLITNGCEKVLSGSERESPHLPRDQKFEPPHRAHNLTVEKHPVQTHRAPSLEP